VPFKTHAAQRTVFFQPIQETPMKKSDLDRNEGLKITGQMKQAGTPDRFGSAAGAVVSRRDQRKLDQAQGLVPFAVKLDGDLVKQIHALAETNGAGINETVAALLIKGLAK
jgi:microcompartment protein CcmK/EutM